MNRQELINQVKEVYANIASDESKHHFLQSTSEISTEAYYEKLLSAVISDIQNGTFDSCHSGSEIISKVASDKSILTNFELTY